jgi:hypothetical protein
MLSKQIRPDVEAAPWVIEEVKKLEAALAASEVECERLASMIVAFCNGASWCDHRWKGQEHIKPLFDFAEERSTRAALAYAGKGGE